MTAKVRFKTSEAVTYAFILLESCELLYVLDLDNPQIFIINLCSVHFTPDLRLDDYMLCMAEFVSMCFVVPLARGQRHYYVSRRCRVHFSFPGAMKYLQ